MKADEFEYFWTFPFMMVVRDDMPEETAYTLVKTFWDNIAEINGLSPALALISSDAALDALSADIHPGAAKYYREIGLME